MTDVSEQVPEDADQAITDLGLGIELNDEDRAEAEEMVAALKARFGFEEDGEEEDAVGDTLPEPDEEPEVEEEPASPPPSAPSDEWISIDGQQVPVAQARTMLELNRWLSNNPSKAEEFAKLVKGEEAKPADPVPEEPPEWLDRDDPQAMGFWQSFQVVSNRLAETEKATAKIQTDNTQARAVADATAGLATFRANHPELTEDDITVLRSYPLAVDLTGMFAQRMPGPDAVVKALDLAYLEHPTFRARAQGEPTAKEKKATENRERKAKLGALSGSSGSAARSEPKPDLTSDQAARAAAVAWLNQNPT